MFEIQWNQNENEHHTGRWEWWPDSGRGDLRIYEDDFIDDFHHDDDDYYDDDFHHDYYHDDD